MLFNTQRGLHGTINVPGDKSISHRSIMFASIAKGETKITDFLNSADCKSTINCFRSMGIDIQEYYNEIIVSGKGLRGLSKPLSFLDAGNSGTTTRLMSGILAGFDFESIIMGDSSLSKRPMERIITPLSRMGAQFTSVNNCLPMTIKGGDLKGINYNSPVASAQVKSAVLLAGLYADCPTSVTEPVLSRNHTELMLSAFGADITSTSNTATIKPADELYAIDIQVPGDISSAAYFIVAGLIVDNSEVLLSNVNVNETRDGIIRVAKAMGANISLENERIVSGEKVCDILIKSSELSSATIDKELIPTLIDEIPVIAVLACKANGTTVIKDAAELKVKESNRIDTVVDNLAAMGADITACDDGMIINGPCKLHGANISCKKDHRIAMAFTIASLIADSEVKLDDYDCVNISYPDFYKDLSGLCR